MKKGLRAKLFAFALALCLCTTMVTPAFAASGGGAVFAKWRAGRSSSQKVMGVSGKSLGR